MELPVRRRLLALIIGSSNLPQVGELATLCVRLD